MLIKTVDVGAIQGALVAQLLAWPDLMDMAQLRVEQGERPPESEANCPWLGVYCIMQKMPLRTLGMGAGVRYQRPTFWVVCKEADPNTGKDCALKLETLVQRVGSALLSDTSIGGTVDFMEEIEVTYPAWGKVAGFYLQTAVMQFTVQTTVQIPGG